MGYHHMLLKLKSKSPRECGIVLANTKSHSYDVTHIPDAFVFFSKIWEENIWRIH